MRTHVSIDVKNIKNSVDFYRKVFGTDPQKQTDYYAKFDLSDPSLNFSMQTKKDGSVSRVNHFGIEVSSEAEVRDWEKRLLEAGIENSPEDQTDCCYALQDKIWFADPDGNAWEVFVVHEQLEVGTGTSKKAVGRPNNVCSDSGSSSTCCG